MLPLFLSAEKGHPATELDLAEVLALQLAVPSLHFVVYNLSMLRPILRTRETEWILLFIASRGSGYAQEMADFFSANLRSVQRQLERLEAGGVLASRQVGRTRVFTLNPRYPFRDTLVALVTEAKKFYPPNMVEALDYVRRRPRRTGKPL